jgi:ABC-type transporter Mla subunit MlaD
MDIKNLYMWEILPLRQRRFDLSRFLCRHRRSQTNLVRGQTIMVSKSLITVKDKPSDPELEGNIRTVWDSAAARKVVESEDDQMSAGDLAASLRETSRGSIAEIDRLIEELQTLRRKLKTDGDRIERDIMQHAELSEQAAKLTKIVFEGVKQLPTRA